MAQKYLNILRKIKDVAFATVDHEGLPQIRIIDVNAMNELMGEGDSVCFLLKEGKTVSLLGYQK